MFKYSGFVCKTIVFYNTFYISTLLVTYTPYRSLKYSCCYIIAVCHMIECMLIILPKYETETANQFLLIVKRGATISSIFD